jgi:Flp pilus assembly pilin Flp
VSTNADGPPPTPGAAYDRAMETKPVATQAVEDDPDAQHSRLAEEEGQGMIEYALVIILVAIGALLALQVLGHATNNLYSNIQTSWPH